MTPSPPVALVTGAARRVGAVIARRLHLAGFDVVLHCRHSVVDAQRLALELNAGRAGSALVVPCDLRSPQAPHQLVDAVIGHFGRLDALVHNASTFYATPIGQATPQQWDELFDANARAPFFLSQAAAPHLSSSKGSVVSVLDIYAERPLPGHPIYCMAKAAQQMMVKSLARELGPRIRVNGVAPGNVLWSENPVKAETLSIVEERTALARQGRPEDIADAVVWLLQAGYVTGQIVAVDGGRQLFI